MTGVRIIRDLEERAKEFAPRSVRDAAKRGLRTFGVLTAPLRTLPDFLIIGAKRGGTTSLYEYLLAHPNVAPLFPATQNIKGIHFFDTNFGHGLSWYRSHFPSVVSRISSLVSGHRRLVGEASPYYLFHPRAPRRAHSVVPSAKLIVLLRNPVDRAYSHYKERRRNGTEPLDFQAAIEREPQRLHRETERILTDPSYVSFAHEHSSYLAQGVYRPQLERWMARYPREQMHMIRSEDLFANPAAVYAEVLRFLGLPAWSPTAFRRFNFHASEDMPSSVRHELLNYFAPNNHDLADFLGINLGWET